MTEMNKDEALRCIDIAVQAYTEGKLDRAGKFLLKAEKLYPTEKAKYLLNKIKTQANTETINTATNTNTEKDANKENVKQRRNSGSRNTTEPEYTSEQIEAVRRLKKCTNYYEILGVSKTATDSEIKKAYKKLALLLHPDKNRAPGASEAFKAVGNAAGVLTDAEKRKQYDLYGINQPLNSNNTNSNGSGMRSGYYTNEFGYTRGFQADVSAEELFNMFFGGGFTQQNVHMRAQRRRQQREEREGQISSTSLTNLLPILLLLGLSMISSFFISDPIYSLTSTAKYSVKRTTNGLKIPYYVKENFYSEYQGSVGRLEESVEEDYINHLKHTCSRERNYRDSLIAKARAFGERSLFDRAQNINMPACENLQKYIKT